MTKYIFICLFIYLVFHVLWIFCDYSMYNMIMYYSKKNVWLNVQLNNIEI